MECGLVWSVLLSTIIQVITVVKICCKTIFSSDTLTKRETAIFKICPPAIITSPEVIVAGYDAILGHWERKDFYNHLSNYTKTINRKNYNFLACDWFKKVLFSTNSLANFLNL